MSEQGIYKYTTAVQLKILAILWRDEQSYTLYRECIKPKYFSKAIHIDICRIIFDYHDKYKMAPTLDALVEEITTMCDKTSSKKKVEDDYLDAIDTMARMELYDIDYIKDKILSFGKRQALVDAIIESADILEKKPDAEYVKIEKLIKDASLVGENVTDLGVDLYDNIEERFLSYGEEDDVIERIPTGMDLFDEKLGGGVGRGEEFVVIAPPGRGKTTVLISMATSALEHGYNVLHISLENNEKQILRNYDTCLLKHSVEYIAENVHNSVSAMNNIKKYRRGMLKIKKYPTKTATVRTIQALLDQLKVVENFSPDVLVIDYGMILKPERNYADKRSGIEEIYEDMRALGDVYKCAIYTGAQANRGSLSKKVVTTADLAECFAIANTSDICLALCQTQKEKSQNIMRGFIAKNRDNPDGMVLKGSINYDTKRINLNELVDMSDNDDKDTDDDSWD